MKGPEARFYDQLVRRFPDWDFQRIETLTSNGVPDINICIGGYEFWCELKAPMTRYGITKLRMEQYAWGMRRAKKGGQVWVFSRYQSDIACWRYPFEAKPGSKGHVTVTSCPNIELAINHLSDLEDLILTIPVRL